MNPTEVLAPDAPETPCRRLLFVTPFAPRLDGRHGGSRVMGQLISRLAERHRVAVAYLRAPGEPDLGALADVCDRVIHIDQPWATSLSGVAARRIRLVAGLARGIPLWAGRWTVQGAASRIREVIDSWKPDIVQIEFHLMGQYAPELMGSGTARVLVEHEPGLPVAEERWRAARGWSRVMAAAEVRAWRLYESRIMRAVDRVVVFTDRDRNAVLPLAGGTPVVRIPLGTNVPVRPCNSTGSRPDVLFVGSFRHPPNVRAGDRLVRRIFPLVSAVRPDATMTIVGELPPAWLGKEGGEAVVITGAVPDVGPYLERAAVVVAPLDRGAGMRVKVLEALAAGKAVVCTPLAAEGLDVRHGEHLLLAESDEDFASAVLRLLSDPDDRRRLGECAHRWAINNAGWDRSVADYCMMYEELLRGLDD